MNKSELRLANDMEIMNKSELRLANDMENMKTHFSLETSKGELANSVDTDQMPQTTALDQGLHCLHQLHEYNKN